MQHAGTSTELHSLFQSTLRRSQNRGGTLTQCVAKAVYLPCGTSSHPFDKHCTVRATRNVSLRAVVDLLTPPSTCTVKGDEWQCHDRLWPLQWVEEETLCYAPTAPNTRASRCLTQRTSKRSDNKQYGPYRWHHCCAESPEPPQKGQLPVSGGGRLGFAGTALGFAGRQSPPRGSRGTR